MIKQSFSFEFDAPPGWREFTDSGRLVFQGPNGEELIVSGASVIGSGSGTAYEGTQQALHANAITAMKRAVDTLELAVKTPLHREETDSGLECWVIGAQSTDGDVLFLQAAVLGDGCALLMTLEAPPGKAARDFFRHFRAHVRSAGEDVVS